MRWRKRILSAVLACVMTLGCVVPVSAAETDVGTNAGSDVTVFGSYDGNADLTEKVISIGYVWDTSMRFKYTESKSIGTWNPQTHMYENPETIGTGSWSPVGNNQLEIQNHSNAAVNVTLHWMAEADYSDVTAGFSENGFVLESAEGTEVSAAPKKAVTVNIIDGALTAEDADVFMGVITIEAGLYVKPTTYSVTIDDPSVVVKPHSTGVTTTGTIYDPSDPTLTDLGGQTFTFGDEPSCMFWFKIMGVYPYYLAGYYVVTDSAGNEVRRQGFTQRPGWNVEGGFGLLKDEIQLGEHYFVHMYFELVDQL